MSPDRRIRIGILRRGFLGELASSTVGAVVMIAGANANRVSAGYFNRQQVESAPERREIGSGKLGPRGRGAWDHGDRERMTYVAA